MKRAKSKKNEKLSFLSNNSFSFKLEISESSITKIVVVAFVFVVIGKLLAMSFSDTDTLIKFISSLLSALGC